MTRATLLLATLLGTLSLGAVAQTGDPAGTETDPGTTGTDTRMDTGTDTDAETGVGTGTTGTGRAGATTGLTFTDLDANNDGALDQDEVDEAVDFDEMDENDDDEVDRNEFMQYQRQQGQQ